MVASCLVAYVVVVFVVVVGDVVLVVVGLAPFVGDAYQT